ncbi:MAG: hypothetical protein A3G33_04795 [Omnitrophica bacterium RIFCSPLOWO2_12_FULL_44_17]|uniref:Uncharacterized protein n=1 Tax=Candidatus Danuiimicrobium aquiferis TaxID=1801832 RepID=A0A1G1KQQ7_9BACT|nr:MAG: hypothetical protein A3B72_11005 [Omnitrophica bacterium RIFCSPHIGHO2_02_FULL_45_28]OGW92473.1 MAG: hypothetical protein A3E74_06845 [Omnitrophica bacterium RIFCSPHIGHO2_12_FULL_44_12]OGW95251.1 MAG: hypothetical protein A3G33_04795 [Omnitrophica bacterium RIFCSPLOWO2_12_FULL_44_17]OGX02346.1 MAG: hypothetical protein A3J12_10130 [Omnitrophica bacterium RIFCSPLOWO2_02_FULL_44_11]
MNKKSIKEQLIIFFSVIFLFASIGDAKPPLDIKIKFDLKTQRVSADIVHHVSTPKTHYVYRVDILVNGLEIMKREYKEQFNHKVQKVDEIIGNVKPGDRISIIGYCILSGKVEKELVVK